MRLRPRATLAALGLVCLVLVAGAGAGPYTVGPPVLASLAGTPFDGCTADDAARQIAAGSKLYPSAELEPRADVNPTNEANIVGEYQQDRWNDGGARGLVASVTHDGGATWARVTIPGVSKCSGGTYDRVSDPWLSFAPNGHLYQTALSFDAFDTRNAVYVSKSTNGGDSWSTPIAVAEDTTNGLDKQSILADPFDARFVYLVWDRFLSPPGIRASDEGKFHARSYVQQTWFSRTTNGGQSWEAPRVAYNPGTQAGTIGSVLNVLPNGDLVDGLIVFADHKAKLRGAQVAVVRSTDRGASWSKKASIVAKLDPTFNGPFDPDTGAPIRSGIADFAVDAKSGALYAVWEDDVPTSGIDAIQFSQSTDGGESWSVPMKLNQTPTNIPAGDQQAVLPAVKVAKDGTVGVYYYDLRNNVPGGGLTTDVWFSHCHTSCSSPASWSETHAAGPFDYEQASVARGEFIGDYEGMFALGAKSFGLFFAQAVGPQATNPSDVYYATASP